MPEERVEKLLKAFFSATKEWVEEEEIREGCQFEALNQQ